MATTTIDDIALAANVSPTTVSNVINGRTNRVSMETLERVNRIINEMGYVPNMSARALVSQSSKVVALIHYLSASSGASFDDPFISQLTSAVELSLRESGYYLMLRTVSGTDELRSFLQNWSVDGLFLMGVFEDDELYNALFNIDKPIVLCDSYLSDFGHMSNVGSQDFEGAKLATEHLLSEGHERIAFCSPAYRPHGVDDKRMQGYREALNNAGIRYDPSIVFTSEFSKKETIATGREIAKRSDITAIFATADLIAAGIMRGIIESGKKVPKDYSVVGFDDLTWCSLTSPGLTTVRQDSTLKGRLAADLMVDMLENNAEPKSITLPVELIERESVSVPRTL